MSTILMYACKRSFALLPINSKNIIIWKFILFVYLRFGWGNKNLDNHLKCDYFLEIMFLKNSWNVLEKFLKCSYFFFSKVCSHPVEGFSNKMHISWEFICDDISISHRSNLTISVEINYVHSDYEWAKFLLAVIYR